MDERVGKTFLEFHLKGGYEEIQQLSTILRISEVKSTRYISTKLKKATFFSTWCRKTHFKSLVSCICILLYRNYFLKLIFHNFWNFRTTKNQSSYGADKSIFKLKADKDEYLDDQPDDIPYFEKSSKMAKNWGEMVTNVK